MSSNMDTRAFCRAVQGEWDELISSSGEGIKAVELTLVIHAAPRIRFMTNTEVSEATGIAPLVVLDQVVSPSVLKIRSWSELFKGAVRLQVKRRGIHLRGKAVDDDNFSTVCKRLFSYLSGRSEKNEQSANPKPR